MCILHIYIPWELELKKSQTLCKYMYLSVHTCIPHHPMYFLLFNEKWVFSAYLLIGNVRAYESILKSFTVCTCKRQSALSQTPQISPSSKYHLIYGPGTSAILHLKNTFIWVMWCVLPSFLPLFCASTCEPVKIFLADFNFPSRLLALCVCVLVALG